MPKSESTSQRSYRSQFQNSAAFGIRISDFFRISVFGFRILVSAALLSFASRVRADSSSTYLACLTNFETYAESIWVPATYAGAPPDSGYWGDGGAQAGNNGGIRGNGGVAVAYAVLVVALPSDPRTPTRLARIRQALNYNAATHFTGTNSAVNGVQWGWNAGTLDTTCSTCTSCSDWQSAEWAGSMGLACLLVQTSLPPATVQAVQRVIASEADHRASVPPCSGYVSDTKAEENGWDGNVLALAAAWMSTSNNAPTWLAAAQSYLANTYTVANTNGDPLASWISTTTLYPEFALENHGFYHPTYEMVAGMSSGDSLLMARLSNPIVAAQLQPFAEHNVVTVWQTNLSYMLLDSGEFAYPSGLDWELHDYEQDSYITWMAAHFNDPQARWADSQLAQLVRYRQEVNDDGAHDGMFVGPSGGGFYREAVEARRTAIAWLHWANADFPSGPASNPPPAVVYFPDVGVIAQRSPWSFISISYKDTIMGMVEAAAASVPTNTYVATPALPGGFGNGALGNPTSATLVSFTTNSLGFTTQLLLQNGANGQTRVYVNSSGESVGIVEVPLPATGVAGTTAGCFTNGIENDPLTGGSRLLEWNGGALTVPNLSNTRTNIASRWICISGRYGFTAGPGGSLRYVAPSSYDRSGAAQDYLNFTPQTRLGARYAVWFPGKNAAQTATLAGQISWTTNGSSVVLSFPGASNSTQTITASLVSSNGTWTADASGNWSDSTKWSGGIVADGAGNTADFSTITLSADRTVTLDSPRTIGTLKFGSLSSTQNWFVASSGGSILTLASSAPSIVVNQNVATLSTPLDGVGGFTKSGPGTLVLNGTNTISGTLYTDSNSTSANDGAVRVTTSGAIGNIGSITIRNNTGAAAASTLQVDGSSGSVVIAAPVTSSCRANTIPCVENIAGSNVLSGAFSMQTGGSNVVFQSDSGTLVLAGALQYIGTLTSPRSFSFFGSGNTLVTAPILYSSIAPLNVGKYGTGTLTLNGANTYTGTTMIYAGVLAGTGTISGPVTVFPGATISPDSGAIGTLTISGALTNNGTTVMHLNKSGGVLTNDAITGVSTLDYGGTLQLLASGDPLTVGDRFNLFGAASYSDSFTAISPAVPGPGLKWNTNNLPVDGSLSVVLGSVSPKVSQVAVAGSNLVIGGSGGAAAANYSVVATTNLSLPFSNWSVVGAGAFDALGNFLFSNSLAPPPSQCFYRIRIP